MHGGLRIGVVEGHDIIVLEHFSRWNFALGDLTEDAVAARHLSRSYRDSEIAPSPHDIPIDAAPTRAPIVVRIGSGLADTFDVATESLQLGIHRLVATIQVVDTVDDRFPARDQRC